MTFPQGREVVVGVLHEALPASALVVAVDPGKVSNRVWLSTGEAGEVVPPLPVLRPGLEQLHRLVLDHAGCSGAVFAIEATGGLHQAWMRELNQRFPGSVRLFAPSETTAARECSSGATAPCPTTSAPSSPAGRPSDKVAGHGQRIGIARAVAWPTGPPQGAAG